MEAFFSYSRPDLVPNQLHITGHVEAHAVEELLEKYDKDGDGEISASEMVDIENEIEETKKEARNWKHVITETTTAITSNMLIRYNLWSIIGLPFKRLSVLCFFD